MTELPLLIIRPKIDLRIPEEEDDVSLMFLLVSSRRDLPSILTSSSPLPLLADATDDDLKTVVGDDPTAADDINDDGDERRAEVADGEKA